MGLIYGLGCKIPPNWKWKKTWFTSTTRFRFLIMRYYGKSFVLCLTFTASLWNCAPPATGGGASPEALGKLAKAQEKDDKFQQIAFKKITDLEKAVGDVRKTQGEIINRMKAMQTANPAGNSGASSAKLDSLVKVVEQLNRQIVQLQSNGTAMSNQATVWQGYAPPNQTLSDKDAILQRFGEPIEKHQTDNNTLVWLYRNGVVSFDKSGKLTSIKFD